MNETAEQVVERFQYIYIGDSFVKRLLVDFQRMECTFLLNAGSILKDSSNPNIFDPAERYEPAALVFYGIRSISCPEGDFHLNSTIVDFEARLDKPNNLVEFYLQMTGGIDNESFMRSIVIKAQNFSLESPSKNPV